MNYLKILIDILGNDLAKLICEYLYIDNTEINIVNSSEYSCCSYKYNIRIYTNSILLDLDFIYNPKFNHIVYILDDNVRINNKIFMIIIREMIYLDYAK